MTAVLTRRAALVGLAAASGFAKGAFAQACQLTPRSTEGPFYFDPKLERSDITEGRPGAPLDLALRVVLLSGNEQVGQAGMAAGADLDRASGVLHVKPGAEASVGLLLTRDDCKTVRVVVLDPASDAVLDQSDEIPVKLGI